MEDIVKELTSRVSPERLRDLTLDLVKIPSPTGDSAEVTKFYADVLKGLGLEVELTYEFPKSPNLTAWLRGKGEGKTLQFDGHADVIPVEHPQPCFKDGVIYGRGAADMKCGLAAMVEVARVIVESGVKLEGNILFTAHGLHEAPIGHGESVYALIKRGAVGDAVINAEGPANFLPVIGKGMCIFEFEISREGEVIHENSAAPDTPHPIIAGHRLIGLIQERAKELSKTDIPFVGPESFFIGQFQSGDFYNRLPVSCKIVGTRRYAPEKTYDDVKGELEDIGEKVAHETGAKVNLNLIRVRDGFKLEEDEPIVLTVRDAYKEVTGRTLPLGGFKSVGDVSIFVREGKVPAVYHGAGGTPHSSLEYASLDDIVRAAKVYLISALRFLGIQ